MKKTSEAERRRGIIYKATGGFYYVKTEKGITECRGRGKLRMEGIKPLVGDRVEISLTEPGKGVVQEILPRVNSFRRPSAANIEMMVIIATEAIPVTDPYLIDRVVIIAEANKCEPVICVNKTDIKRGERLLEIYRKTGYAAVGTSTVTMEGIAELSEIIAGRICAITGNTGVGKSSIINALEPRLGVKTGEVSRKLGRGRHTTRHVELYELGNGAVIADTPGFAAFDTGEAGQIPEKGLENTFREFRPYLKRCRFNDCTHTKEPGCAVLAAVAEGEIGVTRHRSYVRLREYIAEAERNKYK